jgi:hypothetical protein
VFTGRSSIHTIADDGGPVAFKVSDSNHLDNTGLYDVVITVIPETLLPPVIR